ncbi:unnamed protein product [Lathyrus sativus]|nr:unnamed protein product [Lathyrus sativus]
MQFTPVPPPNFNQTAPRFQYQTFNTTFSQPTSTFTPNDVYYPTLQQTQPKTYPQPPPPPHSFQNFLLTDEQLTHMPNFNIDDLLDEQPRPSSRQTNPPTAHHNEDMSSDSSQSPRNERLGKGYKERRSTRCGTGGHLR